MRTPMRAVLRLALTGWLGLAGALIVATPGRAAAPPENVFPQTTVLFAKTNNAAAFREALGNSQIGQLWKDPALAAFKEDLVTRNGDLGKQLKERVGVSLRELYELPQGAMALGVLPGDATDPAQIILTADAGENAAKMADVLTRATQQAEEGGSKVSKEEFNGVTLTKIVTPKPKDAKENDPPPPPLVWGRMGSDFYIGTSVEGVKDIVGHAKGRDDSLASDENYVNAMKKVGTDAQGYWFIEANRFLNLIAKAGERGKNAANVEQFRAMSQVLGINGLKSAGGTITFNQGNYSSVTKTFISAPAPLQGILKLVTLKPVTLKPESWVPANVASYQSFSWDLDDAFAALNDLANMFQPGVLNVFEQQLVGPNGGEPLSFKKDVFDPIGDRVTVISDIKKPITEDSQRMLIGVSLESPNTFQNTLTKLIALAGGAPAKREFQGVTIYDFEMPDIPNANGGNNVQLRGPISVAIAKNTLFITSEAKFLEQILRGGSQSLADSPAYQAVAREIPDKVSSMSVMRPEESARATYEMIKSGQFEKALQTAAVGGGADVSRVGKMFDKDKLPDFSIFAKYLSLGGGYSIMGDDGITITNFSLRRNNP